MRKLLQSAAASIVRAEGRWFDLVHHVRTSGNESLHGHTLAGRPEDGYPYIPTRVSNARRILRNLPITDHSSFTFVDLGSGKGRVLLLAGAYPFRAVVGVEYALELHRQAETNLLSHRGKTLCSNIETRHLDARDYQFPKGDLVVYMFNPFPSPTLQTVLDNLQRAIGSESRQVFVILEYPHETGGLLERTPWLAALARHNRYHLYQSS